MSIKEDRLKIILSSVAANFDFQKYQVRYRKLDENIENYFGVLIPITIVGETKDGEISKNLILKYPPDKKELRDADILEYLYVAEIFVYTVLIPHYKRLSKFDLCELFPECYYSDCLQYHEILVLKDMCCEGFSRCQDNQHRFLDSDHITVSLKSLALFHALSMIFQGETTLIDETNTMMPYSSTYPPKLMIALKNSLKNHLDLFRDTNHVDFFSMLNANFANIVNDTTAKAKRLVIGHGDIWKENILFKYENKKPVKACLLDFQTTHLLCPAQDVLGFLLVSKNAKTRRELYQYFLSVYYDTLQQTLFDHCLDPEKMYSRTDFHNDLKIVAPYCFITTNMSFSLWLGLEEDGLVKSKDICREESKKIVALSNYKEIMLDIAQDFVTFGYT
ncbi:unnamed protein product [Parnassius apollo]|uniref:(apollo) hypothetical protein n=1 Tax=Parnassius apollo TaxID=110799 RepID=A0A8S3WL12_PARAO|nr:unnamed protein product [Parnassius apollo]